MAKFTDENPEEITDGEVNDFVIEAIDYNAYITSACNVMSTISEYEPMTKDNQMRKAMILRKCLKIIDFSLCEIYKELFEQEEEEN